jgi:BNR repeat-like domain
MNIYARKTPRWIAVIGCATLTMLALPGNASANTPPTLHVRHTVDVAGPSPFAGRHCNVATPYYTSPGGKEGEPSIAVNPARPHNRIAVWMDATRATVDVAYTKDGGLTWRRTVPRGIDECTGNDERPWEASGDPWISFGPDGTAYLSTLTWAHFVTPPVRSYVSVVHVQTSHDGGRTWSKPRFLAGHRAVADKPMVVADPYHAGVAYEIWRNQSFGLPVGDRGKTRLYFAATHNGGKTWSDPITIARGARTDFFGSPQVSALRDGTLVATSSLAAASGGSHLLSWRSQDGGRTWRGPRRIVTAPAGENPQFCGQSAAGADTGSSSGQQTVLNGRSVLFVWLNGQAASNSRGKIMLSRSNDRGKTWHTHAIVRSRVPVLLASVAADRHGRLGLVWDRVGSNAVDCAGNRIPVRTRFAGSAHGGRAWAARATLGPSWSNLATGLRGSGGFSGYFVGDYQSIAATRGGFTTVTVEGPALTAGGAAPQIHGANGVIVANVHMSH